MTTANKITLLRIILVPLFMVFLGIDNLTLAFIVYAIACISDFLDGHIARMLNQISDFGKFMDPLADKMLVLSAMCYFSSIGRIPWWVTAIVCFREFAVSGLRMFAAEKNNIIAAATSGKIKTASTMISLAILMLLKNNTLDIIAWLTILITTVYSGVDYFIKNKGVFNHDPL